MLPRQVQAYAGEGCREVEARRTHISSQVGVFFRPSPLRPDAFAGGRKLPERQAAFFVHLQLFGNNLPEGVADGSQYAKILGDDADGLDLPDRDFGQGGR